MLHPRIDGVWLSTIGAWDDLTYSHIWPRGSEEASWRMERLTHHPAISQGGGLFELYNGGDRIFRGRMAEPGGDGTFAANGSYAEAAGVLAVDGSANATNIPDTAIDAAIARGAITWTRPASLSAVSWGTAGEPMKLTDLLDRAMAGLGKRWWVDPDGAVKASVDPTTPAFVVPHAVAGQGLTLAEDTYYSHLRSKHLETGPVFKSVTVGDASAATRFGFKEQIVDLTPMGIISAATATTELTNRLALTGARMGFAESLELGFGEFTTQGGTPVALTVPLACGRDGGLMVRLMGVTDRTRPVGNLPYTDIVIGRSRYADGASTVMLTPAAKAQRDLRELLAGGVA